jgi:hypothetical protein
MICMEGDYSHLNYPAVHLACWSSVGFQPIFCNIFVLYWELVKTLRFSNFKRLGSFTNPTQHIILKIKGKEDYVPTITQPTTTTTLHCRMPQYSTNGKENQSLPCFVSKSCLCCTFCVMNDRLVACLQ